MDDGNQMDDGAGSDAGADQACGGDGEPCCGGGVCDGDLTCNDPRGGGLSNSTCEAQSGPGPQMPMSDAGAEAG
jgi:hypothetical protein